MKAPDAQRDLLFLLPFVAWIWAVRHDPFFWDTVQLASKHAHFYYQNHLTWQHLPDAIDSGHPPLLGYALALCWQLFGKTLPVSHFLMLPFVLATVYFVMKTGKQNAPWLLLLVVFDPVLAGQFCLVSPDVCLICFFWMVIWGYETHRRALVVVGILGLCLISMRGMMTAVALLLWIFWLEKRPVYDFLKTHVPTFSIGFVAAGIFLISHYAEKGWIGHHAGSPWQPAFQLVDGKGGLKNIAVLAWRWLDFGRVGEWIVWAWIIWKWKSPDFPEKWWKLWIVVTLILSIPALLYQNLSAHRYFLPCFMAFHVLIAETLSRATVSEGSKKIAWALMIGMMWLGNFWRYPIGISMDWDATLAHLPHHTVRTEMWRWIEAQHVDYRSVGAAFPHLNCGEEVLLNGDERQFAEFDFHKQCWILWSNVCNDMSRADFENLEKNWQLKKKVAHRGIEMRLYHRP